VSMDQLEKFIRENKEAFDIHNPPPHVWYEIQGALPGRRRNMTVVWKWVAVAAIGLVLLMSGLIAGFYVGQSGFEESAQYAEFKLSEKYYAAQFSERMSSLAQYEYDPEVDQDIQELSELYAALSQELMRSDSPNKEQILHAMISNYQTRIRLLERVLSRIERGQENFEFNEDELPEM
jgi:hypothetical protein